MSSEKHLECKKSVCKLRADTHFKTELTAENRIEFSLKMKNKNTLS